MGGGDGLAMAALLCGQGSLLLTKAPRALFGGGICMGYLALPHQGLASHLLGPDA